MASQTMSGDESTAPRLDLSLREALARCDAGKWPLEDAGRLNASETYVIYGAGGFGKAVASALEKRGLKVLGMIDQVPPPQLKAAERIIVSPQDPRAEEWSRMSAVALIALFNPQHPMWDAEKMLREMKFQRVLSPMAYYPQLKDSLGWRFWLGAPGDYCDALPSIEKALSLMSDDLSKQLFVETLRFRLLGDMGLLACPSLEDQYAPSDLPRWPDPLRVLDGGAYCGDSLEGWAAAGYAFAGSHAFEPDPQNFCALKSSVERLGASNAITLHSSGLGADRGQSGFIALGSGSSRMCNGESGNGLDVTTVDAIMNGRPLDLIKLDIEGAEPSALEGARTTIQHCRPALAIAAYHHPDHLWKIPIQIQEMASGYTFFLRQHRWNSFDGVFYALLQ